MRIQNQRLIPLILLNLVLVAVLLFILDHFKIFSWRQYLKLTKQTETEAQAIEDPFLLEKEELRKQWLVLEEKERLYKERLGEYSKKEQVLEEKLKEADNQINLAKDMQKKQEDLAKQYEDRQANVLVLAKKIGNMPPKDGVALLEKMDPVLAVDVIRRMDALAEELGKKTTTDYLLSLMDKEKASTIIRLISKYPKSPEEQNLPQVGEGNPSENQENQPK